MNFYLDTSAINNLYDDPVLSLLKSAIKDNAQVHISVFTIVELASTSNAERRDGLLRVAKDISSNFRPAAMPGDLLKRSLEAINAGAKGMDSSIGHEFDGLWVALNDPTLLDEGSFREVLEWKNQQENWYHEMHDHGRPRMQDELTKLPLKERNSMTSSFSNFIKYHLTDSEFLTKFVVDMASHSGTKLQIDEPLVNRIIKHSEHWRYFLAAMAYGMYSLSIKRSHFSKSKNPGSIDTQQSIYLALCDIFVTADHPQYCMLRLVAKFGHRHKKRRIWKYSEFASWLLNKGRCR